MDMDPDVQRNRIAWEAASQKHNREYQDLLLQARGESTLLECELDLLRPLLEAGLVEKIGEENLYPRVRDAVEAVKREGLTESASPA